MAFDLTGLGSLAEILKPLVNLIPDPNARARAAEKMQELEVQLAQGQLKVNEAEAASGNWFIAGWRPACGWLCVGALGYTTILAPAFGLGKGEVEVLISILFGMLGLGTLRTVEKVKGAAK
jgi:hypothetical protein